ncbi:hypothetical protein LHFGNBLO_002848 [Mesorhizobium sp. AR10]|nr:hypothetical protein [Mesorhizobium sp. AR10]UVK41267.1 hypothetical protein LHFGNBLO_002848 [Mesorhizobium sp. AR10]
MTTITALITGGGEPCAENAWLAAEPGGQTSDSSRGSTKTVDFIGFFMG